MTTLTPEQARIFPAKTVHAGAPDNSLGISVRQHGLIAGWVLRRLIDLLRLKDREMLVPDNLAVLAGLHDIGKINPLFLGKMLRSLPPVDPEVKFWAEVSQTCTNVPEVPHAHVGAVVVKALTKDRGCAYVVGAHHGWPDKARMESQASPAFGGMEWVAPREALCREIMNALHADAFPTLSKIQALQTVQKDVWTGLVVVSDWIASQQAEAIPEGTEREVAENLVARAGFAEIEPREGVDFNGIFHFSARPEQQAFMSLYSGPGVYVLEAPTGCGKTEAALGLAFEAIRRGDAGGIYFALPTQLTSNKVHDRVDSAVQAFLRTPAGGVQLIHGGARLLKAQMGKEAAPGESWFSSNRQALLAPFGVGTVDQMLLGLLKSQKFASVRAVAQLGKVLILDEIHSYDAYTSTLIHELIEHVEALHGVVIILSATLTDAARAKLLGVKDEQIVKTQSPILLTAKQGDTIKTQALEASAGSHKRIELKLLKGEEAEEKAYRAALQKAMSGQQVLWIENTVSAAQAAAKRFQDAGVVSGLLHSRFRPVDRERLEKEWTGIYGRGGDARRRECGRVLVGTQVLEQSLDIDADFLVTRLAPTDLLIQRFGRLWRHPDRVRPIGCSSPQAWIVAAPEQGSHTEEGSSLENGFGLSGKVYSPPYILFRTLEVLERRLEQGAEVDMPEEVRQLLEETYAEREESGEEACALKKSFEERATAFSTAALSALSFSGVTESDEDEPATRYIDQKTWPILVLDPTELSEVPSGLAAKALWLESRLVKSSRPIKFDQRASRLPSDLETFISHSRRFHTVPIAYMSSDGELQFADGAPVESKGVRAFYTRDGGLRFQ